MDSTLRRFAQTGFTLVELLIVVVILTILAAIVIPQFSSSTTDAREAALDSNLGTLRSAIELYHAQHGFYPAAKTADGATCPLGGKAGLGKLNESQALIDQLTLFSDVNGATCETTDPTFRFGPYIRKGFPNNTISGKGAINTQIAIFFSDGKPITPEAEGAGTATAGGWAYNNISGQLIANSSGVDSGGTKKYSEH